MPGGRPQRRSAPVALLLHGVGSTGDFARRCLEPAIAALGYDVLAPDLRGHGTAGGHHDPEQHSLAAHLDTVREIASRHDVRLVAGISLGAELALRYAAERPDLDGVALCLPGVLGPSSAPAAVNRHIADRIAAVGVEAVLAEVAADPDAPRWVVDELRASWPSHDPASLVAALRAISGATPFDSETVARVEVPVGVVAVVDDAAHPLAHAQHLCAVLPRAALETLTLAEVGADRARLGRAAVAALVSASR